MAFTVHADFESGTVGQVADGTSGFDYAGSSTLYSSDRSVFGTKSAKATWYAGNDGWTVAHGELNFSSVTNGGQIWYRAFMWFPLNWQWGSSIIKIIRIGINPSRGWRSVIVENGQITASNELTDRQNGTGGYFILGEWNCIEMYLSLSTTSPTMRIWLNDALIHEDTDQQLVSGSDYANFGNTLNTWNAGAPVTQTQYLDDYIITDIQPSAQDSYGNYMIGTGDYVPPVDFIPPFIDNLSPSGVLASTPSPRNITISCTTDESATCRFGETDDDYASLTTQFDTTGGLTHSHVLNQTSGTSKTYYVRCQDGSENANTESSVISYSIANQQIAGPGGIRTSGGIRISG